MKEKYEDRNGELENEKEELEAEKEEVEGRIEALQKELASKPAAGVSTQETGPSSTAAEVSHALIFNMDIVQIHLRWYSYPVILTVQKFASLVDEKRVNILKKILNIKFHWNSKLELNNSMKFKLFVDSGNYFQVKKIMNSVYQQLRSSFEADNTYRGDQVLAAILGVIKVSFRQGTRMY